MADIVMFRQFVSVQQRLIPHKNQQSLKNTIMTAFRILNTSRLLRSTLTAALMFTTLIVAGCGGDPEARFLPDSSAARSALELVLNAWKDGKPFGSNKLNEIPVDTFDARWRDGGKLDSFEILGEESVEGRPTFKVRVQIQKAEPIEDVFVVVGNNPLMVFRKQDFDKAGGN